MGLWSWIRRTRIVLRERLVLSLWAGWSSLVLEGVGAADVLGGVVGRHVGVLASGLEGSLSLVRRNALMVAR